MLVLKIFKLYKRTCKENKGLRNLLDSKNKDFDSLKRCFEETERVQVEYNILLEKRLQSLRKLYRSMNGIEIEFTQNGVNLLRDVHEKNENIINFPKQTLNMRWK